MIKKRVQATRRAAGVPSGREWRGKAQGIVAGTPNFQLSCTVLVLLVCAARGSGTHPAELRARPAALLALLSRRTRRVSSHRIGISRRFEHLIIR